MTRRLSTREREKLYDAQEQLDLLSPGMIAVMDSGARVAIWPDEGGDPRAFTGQMLEADASYARASGANLSVFWDRSKVHHIERATEADQAMSLVDLGAL